MHVMLPPWTIDFYNVRVADAVESWPPGIRASFLRIAQLMCEYGPDIGMPHSRALGDGLFEIRAKGREGIGRAFYCIAIGRRIVILYSIIKKTEQTPPRELLLARMRAREVKHDCRSL